MLTQKKNLKSISTAKHILIVDDEDSLRQLLSSLLEDHGCLHQTAASAEEGLAILEKTAIDMALLDIKLPGMSGLELLTKIKEISPDTEVVIMTSHASLETAIKAIQNGAYDYLIKPFDDIEEVWFTVQRALEKGELTHKNKKLLNDLEERNQALESAVKRLTSLNEAGRAMSSMYNINDLLNFFIGLVVNELAVERASFMLMDEKDQELYIAASRGLNDEIAHKVRIKLGEGIAGEVAKSGEPILVEDVNMDPRRNPHIRDENLSNSFISSPVVLSIPVKMQEKVLGVINITNRRYDRSFDKEDLAFLYGLSGQAAVAIEGAKHFHELQDAYKSLKSTQDHLVSMERLKALGQMAAGVAHDFNNILNGILGRTQLLLHDLSSTEEEPSTLAKELKLIERITLQGAEAVQRIQDFTCIRKDLPKEAVNLNNVVQEAVEMTRTKWKDESEARGIKIDVEMQLEAIPDTIGNTHELNQVMSNLIFNAVEAMPEGGTVTIKTYQEKETIAVEIEDTGVGINEEMKEQIFEPFTTSKKSGHGLGLSITYGIISRYEGNITVHSQGGKGSIFTLKLPIVSPATKMHPEEKQAPKPASIPANILVVEDDDLNRELFQIALTANGHNVIAAPNGTEGLVIFERDPFDVVITDLGMPGISGWEVAKGVKEMNPQTPVILLSGWSSQHEEKKIKEYGVDHVLTKPCSIKTLEQTVQNALLIKVTD